METASHQLRTPLAALTTRLELARRDARTDWGRQAFDGIHRDTVRASRLADQLLSLARVEPEALGGGFDRDVDLEDLVSDVARDWVNRALARNIEIEFEAGTGDLVVEGNTALLCEVLNNLIDNALSYCPDGARITIRVGEVSARGVYVQVEDDGPGIPEHRRDDVFERFVRLDPGRRARLRSGSVHRQGDRESPPRRDPARGAARGFRARCPDRIAPVPGRTTSPRHSNRPECERSPRIPAFAEASSEGDAPKAPRATRGSRIPCSTAAGRIPDPRQALSPD